MVDELARTLRKPRLRRKNPWLTDDIGDAYLNRIREVAIAWSEAPSVFRYPRDGDDEPYINLAIAAEAEYLVSRDRDLLDLMDESTPEGADFRARFPNIKIIEPVALLRALAEAER
jgi:predicted nucleic acid-binding protein